MTPVDREPRTSHGDPVAQREHAPASPRADSRRWVAILLVLVLAYAFAARVTVALAVPPWQGPDEPKHFEAARVILDRRADWLAERRYPGEHDESIPLQREILVSFARHGGWTYLGQPTPAVLPGSFYELWPGMSTQLARPSLYFPVAAVALLPFEGVDLEPQLRVLRVLSAGLSTVAVALAYVAARAFAPARPAAALATSAFVAALPMHAFIGGTVNSDNLATLLGSAAVAAGAWSLRRSGAWPPWLATVALTGLALFTKRPAFGLLPAVLFAALVPAHYLLRRVVGLRPSRATAFPFVVRVVASTALVVALAWLGYRLLAAVPDGLPGYLFNESEHPQTVATLPYRSPAVRSLVLWHLGWLVWSFWGVFGWWSVMLPDGLYRALAAVTCLGAAGFLLHTVRTLLAWARRRAPAVDVRLALFACLASGGSVLLAVGERLVYQSAAQVPQGRYLFVAIAPIALVHVVGLGAVLPRRLVDSRLFLAALLVGLVALDAVVYWRYLLPFYAVPPA